MPIYYCGPGGNNANTGLSWAQRKLTLNGVEDIPVAAGDTVYVGPGVYREQLTCDVSGGAGNLITYIGDVTGERTDGIGGIVRITGSDNDQVGARAYCISANNKNYRTFCGFTFDGATTSGVYLTNGSNDWIVEDCVSNGNAVGDYLISTNEATPTNIIIRRCYLHSGYGIYVSNGADTAAVNFVIENCILVGVNVAMYCNNVSGVVVRNVLIVGCMTYGINANSLNPGDSITVSNSIITGCATGLRASALGELLSNYNNIINCNTAYTNVAAGLNDTAYLWLPQPPILHSGASQVSGYKLPWIFGELSEWSQLRAITGASERTVDLFGIPRPATPAKNSWGAVQFHDTERDATTTYDASAASIALRDASRVQMWVPCTNVLTVINVRVYREANYAGVNPQLIVKQPGQADTTITDAGGAAAWNLLTANITPAALPQWVLVELASNNTAAAGNYATYFDSLVVT